MNYILVFGSFFLVNFMGIYGVAMKSNRLKTFKVPFVSKMIESTMANLAINQYKEELKRAGISVEKAKEIIMDSG